MLLLSAHEAGSGVSDGGDTATDCHSPFTIGRTSFKQSPASVLSHSLGWEQEATSTSGTIGTSPSAGGQLSDGGWRGGYLEERLTGPFPQELLGIAISGLPTWGGGDRALTFSDLLC